jgi:hypothetical protein
VTWPSIGAIRVRGVNRFGPASAHPFIGIWSSEDPAIPLNESSREPGAVPGKGIAKRSIRTLKESLLRIRAFDTVTELLEAHREFRRCYNEQWLIERHGFWTPSQARLDFAALSGLWNGSSCCYEVG